MFLKVLKILRFTAIAIWGLIAFFVAIAHMDRFFHPNIKGISNLDLILFAKSTIIIFTICFTTYLPKLITKFRSEKNI